MKIISRRDAEALRRGAKRKKRFLALRRGAVARKISLSLPCSAWERASAAPAVIPDAERPLPVPTQSVGTINYAASLREPFFSASYRFSHEAC